MAVTKEKNGTYKVQYYRTNLDGTRTLTTKRGFTRKSEAEVFDCEMKKRSRKKKIDVGAMFLEDFINQLYFPHIENNLKEKSVINKKNVINEHILNVKNKPISSFKNMKLREITAKAIEDWQIAKQKEDYSKAYLLSMRKELSAVLNFAMNRYGCRGAAHHPGDTGGPGAAAEAEGALSRWWTGCGRWAGHCPLL